MANLSPVSATGMKRTSAQAGIEDPNSKRPRQTYHHFHSLKHQPILIPTESEPVFVDENQAQEYFESSISQILNRIHKRHIRDEDSIWPGAVEHRVLPALRECAEEYLLNICSLIRQSMYACRRVQPIPIDFEYAFKATSIRFDSLLPELDDGHDFSRPSLLPTPPPEESQRTSLSFLDDTITPLENRLASKYVPATFPPFPSKHTYKHTSVYTDRERDPRRIRELATEEGRLGEQALRKLVGAVRTEAKLDLDGKGKAPDRSAGRTQNFEAMESMFEKTMQAVMLTEAEAHADQGENNGAGMKLELAPVVNCERKYWIPESMLKLKREAENVAEKAAEKRKEEFRVARQEKLSAEAIVRVRNSGTPRPLQSKAKSTSKKSSQKSVSAPLKLKIKMKPQSSNMSTGDA